MFFEPRPYRDERDLERMQAILVEGRKAGAPAYYVHVGDLKWWLRYLEQDQDLRQKLYLWENRHTGAAPSADSGHALLGWALFSPRFRAFDLFVHPTERGAACFKRMLTWTVGRAVEIIAAQGGHNIQTMWVSEHDAELIGLLKGLGFAQAESFMCYSTRSLAEPIPELALPPGYAVRNVAGEHEATHRAAASHAAFESSRPFEQYRDSYRAFMRSPVYTPELDIVAVAPDGRCGAFCICWLDQVNRIGLFEPVGTHPDFRQLGLGKAVLLEGLRRMRARGMTAVMVCVEHGNPAAQRLYAAVGFRAVHKLCTFVRSV